MLSQGSVVMFCMDRGRKQIFGVNTVNMGEYVLFRGSDTKQESETGMTDKIQ